MDAQTRRVAHLRLRSSAEALNRRGAILIEDALRTASFPDYGGARVLVIRKLALGRIRANDAPASISLRLEELLRHLAASAVHAASPDADSAPAVYFEDDLEPWVLLAVRLAAHQPAAEWFWPLAAKGWRPAMGRDESIRTLLAGALASSAGPVAALAFVRALVRHHLAAVLAGALRHQDGIALIRAFGWVVPDPVPVSSITPPSPEIARIAEPWFTAWGPADPRSFWFACALCAIEFPYLTMQPRTLAVRACAWIALETHQSSDHPAPTAPPRDRALRKALSWDEEEDVPARKREHLDQASPERLPPEAPERIPAGEAPGTHWFTSRAGLFFLIPAMERLGMPAWLESHPELAGWAVPYRVLHAIALRLDTLPGDPVLAAIGDLPEDPLPEVGAATGDWIRRLRRHCRLARIGLHALVCRPGRIAFTETHIDVMFRLDRADIRVRRAGFDVDPGWTPWLARVIRFHYLHEEACDG